MFRELQRINQRPLVFEHYTAAELWNDEHTSSRMLAHHLDGQVDVSSRKTDFIERSVAWMAKRFQLTRGASLLDLGCGPGLYATRLARLGVDVTGVDFSERSIAYARQQAHEQGLGIDYVCGNYLDVRPSRAFDVVIMIMCDFCALSPKQRKQLLANVRGYLKPHGVFLFDVYSLRAFDARAEEVCYAPNLLDGFWSDQAYFGFLNTFKYPSDHVVLDKYTIVQEAGTRVVYNWLQYYAPEALERELAESGFCVAEQLGNVAGDAFDEQSHEFAVVSRVEDP